MFIRVLGAGPRTITGLRRHGLDLRAPSAMPYLQILLASAWACVVAGCTPQRQTTQSGAPAASSAPTVARTIASAPAVAVTTTKPPKSFPGYRVRQKNGAIVYCKTMARTGSRFEDEYCLSEADLAQLAAKAEEDRQHFRRNQTICGVGVCGDDK